MAHQLINSKKSVPFLGLFDGWVHYPSIITKQNTLDLLSYSNNENFLSDKERNRLNQLEKRRKNLLEYYKLPVLQTNATLFKANELWPSFISIDDEQNGWNPYIKGSITTYRVPGNHETIFFEPNIQFLANILIRELDQKNNLIHRNINREVTMIS